MLEGFERMEVKQPVSPDRFRKLLDACWQARRATEMMPELPEGLRPRHITVLDAIHIIGRVAPVRVGEIAAFLHGSDPGVTKMVQELASLGLISKRTDPEDGRVVNLVLTEEGRSIRKRYVEDYHERLCKALAGTISDEDCLITIRTIASLCKVLSKDMSMREPTAEIHAGGTRSKTRKEQE